MRVGDVDLDKGRLDIIESKQHRSRIVMMADDVVEMLSDCNVVISAVMPEREPFFLTLRAAFMETWIGKDLSANLSESRCYRNRPSLSTSL